MQKRIAEQSLRLLAQHHFMVVISGPHRAGKTHLARACFPDKAYISLRHPEVWLNADDDPEKFLAQFPEGAIIHEPQRSLRLVGALVAMAKTRAPSRGKFILIGGQAIELLLQGEDHYSRFAARLRLLPFSLEERLAAGIPAGNLDHLLWQGNLPDIVAGAISPAEFFPAYLNTLLEREIPQFVALRDLARFFRFMKLCAARIGQVLNLSAMANECGISHVTAANWLSILEDLYIITRLPPYPEGFGKRVVKTDKLYFFDTGLAAWLAGIHSPNALGTHPLRCALFESWVISECLKQRFHREREANLYFWRDNSGTEIHLLYACQDRLQPIAINVSASPRTEWADHCHRWRDLARCDVHPPILIYGGERTQSLNAGQILPWRALNRLSY